MKKKQDAARWIFNDRFGRPERLPRIAPEPIIEMRDLVRISANVVRRERRA